MEDSWLREQDLSKALDLLQDYNLGMGFDLFDLLLTSGANDTSRGMPCTFQAPLSKRVCLSWGMFLANWTGTTEVRDFFCFFSFG